jgi:hypothetical protein
MYVAKEDFILKAASGRSVLHLGCVGFTDLAPSDRVRSAKQSLHWKLTQLSNTVGIDRSVAVIDEYRKLGVFTNIVAGDVERLDDLQITRKFDVVIAGDIIEHLSNPGQMLDGIKRFCRKTPKSSSPRLMPLVCRTSSGIQPASSGKALST